MLSLWQMFPDGAPPLFQQPRGRVLLLVQRPVFRSQRALSESTNLAPEVGRSTGPSDR